jgi:plastocyanin
MPAWNVTATRRGPPQLSFAWLFLLFLVSCAPPAPTSDTGAQQVLIVGLDAMRFDPPTLTVDAGTAIRLVFENKGQLVHDASFTEAVSGPGVKLTAASNASASSRSITFEQPGAYRFVCSQPGHEAAGMWGTLIVR